MPTLSFERCHLQLDSIDRPGKLMSMATLLDLMVLAFQVAGIAFLAYGFSLSVISYLAFSSLAKTAPDRDSSESVHPALDWVRQANW